jgi:hypothetical protein
VIIMCRAAQAIAAAGLLATWVAGVIVDGYVARSVAGAVVVGSATPGAHHRASTSASRPAKRS